MKTLVVFLLIFSIKSFATTPTLAFDCSVNTFARDRMPAERATLWMWTGSNKVPDLQAQEQYDAELFAQALVCAQRTAAVDLSDCYLDRVKVENEWQYSDLGLKNKEDLYKIKKEILMPLRLQIERCFAKTALQMTPSSLETLYENLSTLSRAPYDIFPPQTTTFSSCRCKDAERSYTISLGDITAHRGYDEIWKVTVDRDTHGQYSERRGKN